MRYSREQFWLPGPYVGDGDRASMMGPAFVERLKAIATGGELTVIRAIPAVRTTRSDPVVRALSAAIRTAGGSPRPTLKTGTSDMNTVSTAWTVPMAGYGPGDGSLDHSAEESIGIAEFRAGIAVLTGALDQLATEFVTGLT